MKVVGRDETGRLVVDGVYKFSGTYGLPFEILFSELNKRNLVPCIAAFIIDALAEGTSRTNLRSRLEYAVGEVYGRDYQQQFIQRFRALTG